ncbi:MAG: FAD-binding and (Fe-S)-binding domain-containing protein [Pelagibacterium sp.]|uniref:FAD-binding and (Fe-S)-binding domain-containing protein n=1 Tax=Pelagibacterium sp. TaxID=1967288 RepID=UPI0032EBEABD
MPASAPPDHARLQRFIAALEAGGFSGDIETGFATREVLATDNSIYRLPPVAAIFPRTRTDIVVAGRAVASCGADGPSLTARGGGTGTNGQSLNEGVILDTSRYLTNILDFDPDARTVTVEPGVVLDQLNAFLAPHGWFFPPTVSTASRATLGGMVATDASGKGSRRYGRTSDYVERLDLALADGTEVSVAPLDRAELARTIADGGRVGEIVATAKAELDAARPHFEDIFPRMNRGLTGYNLKEALPEDGGLNLCKILAGSEGTLALTTAIKLRLARKPRLSGLMVLFYDTFSRALAHVPKLVEANPLAVEIFDDKILGLARTDPVWANLSALFGALEGDVGAVNFVEVTGETAGEIAAGLADIERHLTGDNNAFLMRQVTEPAAIEAAWALRAKSVGLLGALEGRRKAYPFVEDTAVPPENLVAYVTEFRALLDSCSVAYGMFGHADVGCLHVRPTLDMTAPADRALVREISDGVQVLTRKYSGLIWGEHGRGVRGEYLEEVFGPDLYPVVRRIKALFDPENRLNPGKLASPTGSGRTVLRIDEVPFRGASDATIAEALQLPYEKAVSCNGNGACHDWNPARPMCPSYKATRDKTQSPNGRASLFRAWAREPSAGAEAALKQSLDTCLSCRSCATACPVKVDIPTMKSRFLESYYTRHARSPRDLLVRVMEPAILAARKAGALANAALHNPLGRAAMGVIGLAGLPKFAVRTLEARLRSEGIAQLDLANPPRDERAVVVIPDSFLASFDVEPVVATAKVLRNLGFVPLVAPVMMNGKALEVRGYRRAYAKAKKKLHDQLARIAKLNVPMVAIEPATTMQARTDGAKFLVPIETFLAERCAGRPPVRSGAAANKLFLHCTESSSGPAAGSQWKAVFAAHGADVEVVETGCCGMSGLFGHEAEHLEMSRRIFELSWAKPLSSGEGMATGFSCRCQTKRLIGRRLLHPIEVLAERIGCSVGA